ncbi:2-methylaconitate cis-trans isomerase PrpF [Acidovorax sp. CCYZU-2555]|uniref:2-methylaconitate cis-trans isomerase PrpF n=1 Tax=Acidovorax sp. CCYZU-2555 TaxID=2835042 RepID=UPI001BCA81C9|nr:2-methylaconitate cis-trans isomerase PrpF [Acidovorax sp. CCYZU-2555]MBS7776739.1 2-methylaconitate cis-trans isomerase PrpF [Acidovorax sp. CCYZU-2555]
MQKQIEVRATFMRGGSSKGVFFETADVPADPARRDALLLRVIGSPDPYGKQTDGMGAATSSTSKVVLVSRSARADCDVDYLFGQVDIEQPRIDWTGNCGNLTTAVGPFAIARGLVDAPADGMAVVRIWQANIGKVIVAHVPMAGGSVQELGDFVLDGVAFPAAQVRLEFLAPGGDGSSAEESLLPTGRVADVLAVEGVGTFDVTYINAGNPTIFLRAGDLGLTGKELQPDVNGDAALLARIEAVRAAGAVAMGLATSAAQATASRPGTPKLAWVAPPADYVASSGKAVPAQALDLLVRIVSMGKLHHAITGTGAVAVGAAAAVDGSIVAQALRPGAAGRDVRMGHTSGVLAVGAKAEHQPERGWVISQVSLSRSARRLMEGVVLVPPVG